MGVTFPEQTLIEPAESKVAKLHTPDIARHEASRMLDKYKAMSPSAYNFLERIYRGQINHFEMPEPSKEGYNTATNILESFFSRALDTGLMRDITFSPPGEQPIQEEGFPILGRSAFFHEVLQKVAPNGKYEGASLQLGMFDIKDLRGADFAVEGSPHRSADLIVNRSAKAIQQAIDEVWQEFDLGKDQSRDYYFGRYGGDEFVLALIGDFKQVSGKADIKAEIESRVKRHLATRGGYYRKNKGIVQEEILLKGDKVDWIDITKDSPSPIRDTTLSYLSRGLILNQEQAMKIQGRRTSSIEAIENSIYPTDIQEEKNEHEKMRKKILHLAKMHPELATALFLAEDLDLKEQKVRYDEQRKSSTPRAEDHNPVVKHRREAILHFIENIVYDKLLGDTVYSKYDFQEHVTRGEVREMYVVDLKFIKEMNDYISYVDADDAIVTLWNKISSSIKPEEREHLIFGRYGGTFLIGVRGDPKVLSESTRKAIASIQNLSSSLGQNEAERKIQLPLGNAHVLIKPEDPISSYHDVLIAAEDNFYDSIISLLRAQKYLSRMHPTALMFDSIVKIEFFEGKATLDTLLWQFFNGKRWDERINKLLNRIKQQKIIPADIQEELMRDIEAFMINRIKRIPSFIHR